MAGILKKIMTLTAAVLLVATPILFQSTLPVRGATCPPFVVTTIHPDFNPRSP